MRRCKVHLGGKYYEMFRDAQYNDWDAVFAALDQGLNIHEPYDLGESLLQFAVEKDNLDAAKELLKRKHYVDMPGSSRETPLFFARSGDMVRLLASYGADPNYEVNDCTPFGAMVINNKLDAAKAHVEVWGVPQGYIAKKNWIKQLLKSKYYEMVEVLTGIRPTETDIKVLEDFWSSKRERDKVVEKIWLRLGSSPDSRPKLMDTREKLPQLL